jgi:hypothetical protein
MLAYTLGMNGGREAQDHHKGDTAMTDTASTYSMNLEDAAYDRLWNADKAIRNYMGDLCPARQVWADVPNGETGLAGGLFKVCSELFRYHVQAIGTDARQFEVWFTRLDGDGGYPGRKYGRTTLVDAARMDRGMDQAVCRFIKRNKG